MGDVEAWGGYECPRCKSRSGGNNAACAMGHPYSPRRYVRLVRRSDYDEAQARADRLEGEVERARVPISHAIDVYGSDPDAVLGCLGEALDFLNRALLPQPEREDPDDRHFFVRPQGYRDFAVIERGGILRSSHETREAADDHATKCEAAYLRAQFPKREALPSEDEPDEREETMKRYGLPDAYPFNEPEFCEAQAASAVWRRFDGPTDETVRVGLNPGQVLELWPGGAVFNEHGTLLGWLEPILPPGTGTVSTDKEGAGE